MRPASGTPESGNDVLVVGAGIVGIAVASALLSEGRRVTLVDRDPEGDKASFGNAGGLAVTEVLPASVPGTFLRLPGWILDPLGPLAVRPGRLPKLLPWLARFSRSCRPDEFERLSSALAMLNGRALGATNDLLASNGLQDALRPTGALTVYETDRGLALDQAEWSRKAALGIETTILSGQEARALEPALSPLVKHAVLTPQWAMVADPKRLVDDLRASLLGRGLVLQRHEIVAIAPSDEGATALTSHGTKLSAQMVVIAAGAWSERLVRSVGDSVLLESERGYNVTFPNSAVRLQREIIFGERKFVAAPLTCGLRIGGAAEFAGLEARPNYRRAWRLARLATRYFPDLTLEGGTAWMGQRPATPDSLPVIGRSPRAPQVIYAFGHGHLGLTQAAITAELVADVVARRAPRLDLQPFSIARF